MNIVPPPAKNLSPFGQASLALDQDFSELERLAGEIERMEIQTDNGFERAKKLLGHFGETGERIGSGVQAMARELEAARARAEAAATIVSAKAAAIQQRQIQENEMSERFNALGEMVRKVTTSMAQLQKPAGTTLSEEERNLLTQHLPEMDSRLGMLVDEARKLQADAEAIQLKSMVKNADAMAQSLDAARRKLSLYVDRPSMH